MEFAFTAVTTDTGAVIGIAQAYTPGYLPWNADGTLDIPEFKTYDEAATVAAELNTKLGLTTLQAWRIVASTMR